MVQLRTNFHFDSISSTKSLNIHMLIYELLDSYAMTNFRASWTNDDKAWGEIYDKVFSIFIIEWNFDL